MANLFKDFDTEPFMKRKPPSDNSFDTDQELKQLAKIPINKKFIEEKDDVEATFKKAAQSAGVEYPSGLVKKLMDDSTGPILKLKKHFNRPRPKVLAKRLGMNFKDYEMSSMKTASYPSGHSTQGILIAKVLADKFPNASKDFIKAIEIIFNKYHIQVKQFLCGKYIRNSFEEDQTNIFSMCEKIIDGHNENEIFSIPKFQKNKGFFEKFFNFFN